MRVPAFDARVLEVARTYGKICMPGALTPTEALVAWQAGADLVKNSLQLVEALLIELVKGPFPQMRLWSPAASIWKM